MKASEASDGGPTRPLGANGLQRIDDNLIARAAVVGVGFLPIACLALALGGWLSLQLTTLTVLLPAWLAMGAIAAFRPPWGKVLGLVLLAGMSATLVYDVARLALTHAGGLSDGIPNIGRLLLNDMNAPTNEVFGLAYAYRYLGDGGGLALAYAMGRRYGLGSGMAFGAAICGCLWVTLAVFPVAQTLLFPLTPYAMFMTMVGHLIFGGVLGGLLARWLPPAAVLPTITLTVSEAAAMPAARVEAEASR